MSRHHYPEDEPGYTAYCGHSATRREAERGCCDRCARPLAATDPIVLRTRAIQERARAVLDAQLAAFRAGWEHDEIERRQAQVRGYCTTPAGGFGEPQPPEPGDEPEEVEE